MFSFIMKNFRKNAACPASQDLLNFQNGKSAAKTCKQIKKHIHDCEFCTTELSFYARFPQSEEIQTQEVPCEIPAPLYELAEAMLSKKYLDFLSLNKLFPDNEAVKI